MKGEAEITEWTVMFGCVIAASFLSSPQCQFDHDCAEANRSDDCKSEVVAAGEGEGGGG